MLAICHNSRHSRKQLHNYPPMLAEHVQPSSLPSFQLYQIWVWRFKIHDQSWSLPLTQKFIERIRQKHNDLFPNFHLLFTCSQIAICHIFFVFLRGMVAHSWILLNFVRKSVKYSLYSLTDFTVSMANQSHQSKTPWLISMGLVAFLQKLLHVD